MLVSSMHNSCIKYSVQPPFCQNEQKIREHSYVISHVNIVMRVIVMCNISSPLVELHSAHRDGILCHNISSEVRHSGLFNGNSDSYKSVTNGKSIKIFDTNCYKLRSVSILDSCKLSRKLCRKLCRKRDQRLRVNVINVTNKIG